MWSETEMSVKFAADDPEDPGPLINKNTTISDWLQFVLTIINQHLLINMHIIELSEYEQAVRLC